MFLLLSRKSVQSCPGETKKRVLDNCKEIPFADFLDSILKAKKLTRRKLADNMGYDAKIFSRINSGDIPPKKTVITMGVVLGFNIDQMDIFLYTAGYLLNPQNIIDAQYIEVIKNIKGSGLTRLDNCNEFLEQKGFTKHLLGNHSRKSYKARNS